MALCVNPQTQTVAVPVGASRVYLKLRAYDTREYAEFLTRVTGLRREEEQADPSWEARAGFIDRLLVGISARDAQGREETLEFADPESGEVRPLNPEVKDWTSFVPPSWKIAASFLIEGRAARFEEYTLKN